MADPARLGGVVAAVALIHLALVQPNHPGAATWEALGVFPLELPVLLVALVIARGAAVRPLRRAITAFLATMVVIKAADLAMNSALGRSVNLALDLHLVASGWRLLSGSVGAPLAVALLATASMVAVAAVATLWWATGRIASIAPAQRARAALGVLLVPATALALADAARGLSPVNPPGAALTARLAWEHARDAVEGRADLATFRIELAETDPAAAASEEILPALRGTDVVVIFVESYGRAAVDQPLYAPTIRETLAGIEQALTAQGLATRSGFLTAPIAGGQSWLAHASLLSGLRVDTEARYRALLASRRLSLPRLAQRAGWRSVGVMPAITLDWPEAAWFGYDRLLAANDLGYAGPPFNWVTMPDQFTLAAFAAAELDPDDRPPVFAEIALISSHAPWTPIPPLLPPEALGDGAVYAPFAAAGPTPEDVWRDDDRVRAQYLAALDYSLQAVGDFARQRSGAPPLIIVLGDHQPAPFVSLDPTGRDVPIHAIGPPDIVARFADWGWSEGLVPEKDAPSLEMSAFRDRFLASFGASPLERCAAVRHHRPLPKTAGC